MKEVASTGTFSLTITDVGQMTVFDAGPALWLNVQGNFSATLPMGDTPDSGTVTVTATF